MGDATTLLFGLPGVAVAGARRYRRPDRGRLSVLRDVLGLGQAVIATMVVILVVGVLVDIAFTVVDEGIRRRRGIAPGAR